MIRTVLEPHQIEGVEFISTKRFGILGFKTGKGKTLTTLAALEKYVCGAPRFAVIFGPKNAIELVWPDEIEKHTNWKFTTIEEVYNYRKLNLGAPGSLDYLNSYEVILVKYSEVAKYSSLVKELCTGRITVYDEAHHLRNQKTELVSFIMECTRGAKCKWGLTATAIFNSIMDLYGIMEFIEPAIFGTEQDFKNRYCKMKLKVIGKNRNGTLKKAWEIVDYQNLDELKLLREKFIMVVEQDIEVHFTKIAYTMTAPEERAYLIAAQGILIEDNLKGFAQRLPDLQKVVDGSRDEGGLLTTNPGSKYFEYRKKFQEAVDKKESMIIFTEYYDTFDFLYYNLKIDFYLTPIYKICGKEREMPTEYPCIVLATAGGSESLNLKFANHVFFYSIPFSIKFFIQTLGRITRMDSKYLDNLNCYTPFNETNIDFYKYRLMETNAVLINALLGTDANIPKVVEAAPRSAIVNLRKSLLWKTKELK